MTVDDIVAHLQEVAAGSGLEADEDALRLIAIQAEGGMRDALSLLDQCGVMNAHITVDTVRGVLGIVGREGVRALVGSIGNGQLSAALSQFNALLAQGKAVEQVLAEVSEYLRALLLYKSVPDYEEIYLTDTQENLTQLAPLFTQERLLAAEERLHEAARELRFTMRSRITAEMALVDLCRNEGSTLAALAARVAQLESQLAHGVVAAPQGLVQPAAPVQQTQVYTKPVVQTAAPARQAPATSEAPVAPAAPSASQAMAGVADTAAKPAIPVHTESDSNVAKVNVQPAASAPVQSVQAVAVAQPAGPQEFGGDIATGEDYWRQALDLLKGERKMAMFSCAKNGRAYSFENDILTLAFKAEFLCKRVSADDYRTTIEEILFRVARKPVRLAAITEAEAAKRRGASAPPKAQRVSAAVEANLEMQKEAQVIEENLPPNLQKAFHALGGTITEVKGSKT